MKNLFFRIILKLSNYNFILVWKLKSQRSLYDYIKVCIKKCKCIILSECKFYFFPHQKKIIKQFLKLMLFPVQVHKAFSVGMFKALIS